MEWSKELTTHLIALFREKRVLWDPTFRDFKNRNKKHDAWSKLGAELKTDTIEVEKKIRMLIGQFQRELKKGKSGDGADVPYKTKWIYFNKLLFLKDKNEPRHSIEGGLSFKQDTETEDSASTTTPKEPKRLLQHPDMQNETEKRQEKPIEKSIARKSQVIKRRTADTRSAYALMKQLSSDVKKRDQFDVFGEYVANTLRNLKSKSVLSHAKYEINNALYRAEMSDVSSFEPSITRSVTATPFASLVSTPNLADAEDNSEDGLNLT